MARPSFDSNKAARVLIDAHFTTDVEAARKHGIARRTVINYRNRLETDAEFAQVFTVMLEQVRGSDDWDWLTDALREGIRALIESFGALPKDNPEAMQAITQGVQMLSQYEQIRRVIDAKLEAMRSEIRANPQQRSAFVSPTATA